LPGKNSIKDMTEACYVVLMNSVGYRNPTKMRGLLIDLTVKSAGGGTLKS
jgi:hypothetical protein